MHAVRSMDAAAGPFFSAACDGATGDGSTVISMPSRAGIRPSELSSSSGSPLALRSDSKSSFTGTSNAVRFGAEIRSVRRVPRQLEPAHEPDYRSMAVLRCR